MTDNRPNKTLRLDGALTLRNADTLRAALLEAVQDAARIEIDCRDATEIDVSFLQLLLAARRSAAACAGSVVLAAPVSGALRDAALRAGFLGAAGGRDNPDDGFWTGSAAAP